MTSPADTLTVQQLDELEELHGRVIRDDRAAEWLRLTMEHDAIPALLATVRRQQAALDAVTELADALDIDAAEEAVLSEGDGLDPYEMERKLGLSQGIQSSADALRTALASPAPTEATT